NAQNGISMLKTAEGALDEVSNILLRMKDLATEAANATTSTDDKTAMQKEFTALNAELTNIMTNTKFGGQALLSGGSFASSVTFQIGADAAETYAFDGSTSMTAVTTNLGTVAGLDLTTGANG